MTAYTVAIDDTLAGRQTVDWVDENVDAVEDRVRLLTVIELYGDSLARIQDRLATASDRLRLRHPGLRVEQDVTGGPTADRLVADADLGDVLVIGSRQVHTILATLAGRIAERVVAHARTPVVVVPERWEHGTGPVVVGVDGRTAASALAFAADRAVRARVELVLLRAWEVPTEVVASPSIYLEEDRHLWERESVIELEAALDAVASAHPDLPVRAEQCRGLPADELLRCARGASLVVVGRRHRTAIGAFLAGSVGETLMHRSTAPLCVVPQVAARGPDA
jgi:nucleotide-binding universal stress UspA family protein